MLLIDSWYAAMCAENNMIYEMGIAHNGTKVSIIARLYNCRKPMESPSATRLHDALPAVPPLTFAMLR